MGERHTAHLHVPAHRHDHGSDQPWRHEHGSRLDLRDELLRLRGGAGVLRSGADYQYLPRCPGFADVQRRDPSFHGG